MVVAAHGIAGCLFLRIFSVLILRLVAEFVGLVRLKVGSGFLRGVLLSGGFLCFTYSLDFGLTPSVRDLKSEVFHKLVLFLLDAVDLHFRVFVDIVDSSDLLLLCFLDIALLAVIAYDLLKLLKVVRVALRRQVHRRHLISATGYHHRLDVVAIVYIGRLLREQA